MNDVDVVNIMPHQQPRDLPDMFFPELLDPREATDLTSHLENFRLPSIEDDVEGGAPGLGNVFMQDVALEESSDEDSNDDDDHEEGLRGESNEGWNEGIDDEEGEALVQDKETVVAPVICPAAQPGTDALCGFPLQSKIHGAVTCKHKATTCAFKCQHSMFHVVPLLEDRCFCAAAAAAHSTAHI